MESERPRSNIPLSSTITDKALASIVDHSEDAIITKTLDGRIITWNKGAEKIYGYLAHEVIGEHISLLTPPEVSDEIPQILDRLSKGEQIEHYETVRKRKDGDKIRISLTISPIRDENGKIVAASAIARDITENSRMTSLRNFLASIVDSSDDAILSKDLNGTILSWNSGAERLYGYSAAEMIGKNVSLLAPFDRPDEIPGIMKRLKKGERIDHFDTVRVTKDGRFINVSLTVSPIRDESGNVVAASASARDITARIRDEEERARLMNELNLALNQKNLLLQEVYHRVKNNLQVISSLLDLRSKYLMNDPAKTASAFQESIERIRAMSLVHEKLYKTGNLEKLDLLGYLKTLIEQLFQTYSLNRKIELKIEGTSAKFGLDTAIPLGLIFNELVTNSLKHAFAASSNGCILIQCSVENDLVRLHYSDNGNGLPENIDFSASETFGFRIIRLLTKQIKGTIKLVISRGTRFEITIPYKFEG